MQSFIVHKASEDVPDASPTPLGSRHPSVMDIQELQSSDIVAGQEPFSTSKVELPATMTRPPPLAGGTELVI